MLRINLLPPYIYDKQKKYKWIAASVGIFVVALASMLWWIADSQKKLEDANKANEEAKTLKSQYDTKVQAIQAEQAAIAVTKAKMEFISNAIKYNQAWPDTYAMMRDLTSPYVLLKNMDIADDHKTVNMSGFSQREEDLVRWWMFLRATKLFGSVHFNLPEHPWPPKAEGTSASGAPGSIGMSPGSSSGGMSIAKAAVSPTGGGFGNSAGAYGSSAGGFGSSAGGFGGRSGGTTPVGDEEIEGRKGISFTATAVLVTPLAGGITLPTWTGAAPAAAAPGLGAAGPGSAGPAMNPGGRRGRASE